MGGVPIWRSSGLRRYAPLAVEAASAKARRERTAPQIRQLIRDHLHATHRQCPRLRLMWTKSAPRAISVGPTSNIRQEDGGRNDDERIYEKVDALGAEGIALTDRYNLLGIGDIRCVAGVISRERHIEIYDVGGAPTWRGSALRCDDHRAAGAALARKQVATLGADDPALVGRYALPDIGKK